MPGCIKKTISGMILGHQAQGFSKSSCLDGLAIALVKVCHGHGAVGGSGPHVDLVILSFEAGVHFLHQHMELIC